jgi:hypothetical protein
LCFNKYNITKMGNKCLGKEKKSGIEELQAKPKVSIKKLDNIQPNMNTEKHNEIINTEPVEIASASEPPENKMNFDENPEPVVAVEAAPMIHIERRGSGVRTSIKGMATVMQE